MAIELFFYPPLKTYIQEQYFTKVHITTEPTALGKDITILDQNYLVKRIRDRPLSTFNEDLWLILEQAEKDGLINI